MYEYYHTFLSNKCTGGIAIHKSINVILKKIFEQSMTKFDDVRAILVEFVFFFFFHRNTEKGVSIRPTAFIRRNKACCVQSLRNKTTNYAD